MSLSYGTNLSLAKSLPELIKPATNENNFSWLIAIGRFLAQFAIQVAITALARNIDIFVPGLGILAEAGLTFGTDLLFDYLQNGELTQEDIGFAAGFSFIPLGFNLVKKGLPFIKKGLKFISSKHTNKFYGIASQMKDRTLANQVKKIGRQTFKIGIDKKIHQVSQVFNNGKKVGKRAYFKSEKELKYIYDKFKPTDFKNTISQNQYAINNFRQKINQAKNYLFITRQLTSAATSPRYLAKKGSDMLTHKYKKKINNYLGSLINQKADSIKKGLSTKLKKFGFLAAETPKIIPVKSSVIDGIKLVPNNDRWDFATMSAVIFFNKQATFSNKSGPKKPIYLSNKNANKILEFLTTKSPMGHYIDNFSYGWEIGKFLRNNKEFLFMSKIPIFSNFVNHLFWTYKTVEGIISSINKKESEWQKDKFSEFGAGILDNSLKGWNLPYISPSIHISRGFATKNDRYFTTTAFKQTNKQLKNYKIKKQINKMKRKI